MRNLQGTLPRSSIFERAFTDQKMETWRTIMTVHFSKKKVLSLPYLMSLFELGSKANTNVELIGQGYWWAFLWYPGTTEIS